LEVANEMTFERFLREAISKPGEVRLVPRAEPLKLVSGEPLPEPPTRVVFYAHVLGHNSNTVDFEVRGDQLVPLNRSAA